MGHITAGPAWQIVFAFDAGAANKLGYSNIGQI